jgi:hypothetical protein
MVTVIICFIGGGFHHCRSDDGGGFCAYADITLSIHVGYFLQYEKIPSLEVFSKQLLKLLHNEILGF